MASTKDDFRIDVDAEYLTVRDDVSLDDWNGDGDGSMAK